MDINDIWSIKFANDQDSFKPIKPDWRRVKNQVKKLLKNSPINDPDGPWSLIGDGWDTLYFPRKLLSAGYPIELVDDLTKTYESDLTNPHATYYINRQPVSHFRGIPSGSLSNKLCSIFDIKGYRGDFGGHGAAARAQYNAIVEHFTTNRHAKGNHSFCDGSWCQEYRTNYKQIQDQSKALHDSGDHSDCRKDDCTKFDMHNADDHSRCNSECLIKYPPKEEQK